MIPQAYAAEAASRNIPRIPAPSSENGNGSRSETAIEVSIQSIAPQTSRAHERRKKLILKMLTPADYGGRLHRGDLFRLACRLRWEGASFEWAVTHLVKQNRWRSKKPLTDATVKRMVGRVWAKFGPGRSASDAPVIPRIEADANRQTLADISRAVAATLFSGRTGGTDLRVLTALLQLADACARVEFSTSNRRLAEAAGCDVKTVRASIPRLEQLGFVEIVAKGSPTWSRAEGPTATIYRLQLPPDQSALARSVGQNSPSKAPHIPHANSRHFERVAPLDQGSPRENMWRSARPERDGGGGFGERGRQVWAFLMGFNGAATTEEIHAGVSNFSYRTVDRALKALSEAGLVVRERRGRYRANQCMPSEGHLQRGCAFGCTPGEIRHDCPTHDAAGRQQRMHQAERETFERVRWDMRRRYLVDRDGWRRAKSRLPLRLVARAASRPTVRALPSVESRRPEDGQHRRIVRQCAPDDFRSAEPQTNQVRISIRGSWGGWETSPSLLPSAAVDDGLAARSHDAA